MTFFRAFFILLILFHAPAHAVDKESEQLEPITLKLQWQHQFQFAGIYAAIEKGFYANAGFNVSVETGYTHPYDEVQAGTAQFGISGTGIITEYLKGRPFIALGATFQNSPYIWLFRADSGIYSAQDFIGKTLTRQSAADDLASIFLKQNINTNLINFVPPSTSDIDDLVAGRVDAITAYVSNEPYMLDQRIVPWRSISPQDYGINFYSDILFTTQSYAQENPEKVQAFREAAYEGWRYAAEHPDEIIELILQKYNTQHKSREHLKFEAKELLKLSLYPTVNFGHMSQDRWRIIAETYQQLGLYDEIKHLDKFIFSPPQDTGQIFKWIASALALLIILISLGYQLKKRHHAILEEKFRQQTASLEAELQTRKELEAAARHEQLRLQTLLDNTLDSVITIDHTGVIEHYNKASSSIFGYAQEEVLGQNITMLMPKKFRDMHKLGMARFLSTERSKIIGKTIEIEALHKSGQSKPIELTVTQFRWEGHYLFIGIARDISSQKQEHIALLEAKLEAERANNAKSEFLSAMSHELRTPLNGILGFSQLLLSDKSPELSGQQVKNVQQIIHSGEHLLTLINGVLELSKIESGNIEASTDHITISSLIDECLPMLHTMANKYNVSIINDEENEQLVVLADYTKLKQVFINLVINAIKYNREHGEVIISTEVLNNNHLRIKIRDTGMGIPLSKQDKVFTAFERLGQEYADIEGTGVGLSVSKRLIEAMNGQISFESKSGEGSLFWVDLPLSSQPSSVEQQRVSLAYQNNESLSMRRADATTKETKQILYIEDNPANIRLMEVFFSRLKNTELHTCESAEEGLDRLKTFKPDIVLMDINLGGMSGLDAAKLMQEDPELKHIPVIALTAAAMQENIDAAEGLFRSYITKPIDFSLLSKTMQALL